MGIINYFKKLLEKEEVKKTQKEKIKFSEILEWIKSKEGGNKEKEREFFILLEEKMGNFLRGIDEKIVIAQSVDVESKKADSRLKAITNEGRRGYIDSLKLFINNLNNLEKKEFGKFVREVDRIFANFSKFSNKNYERATVLIGKEMAQLRNDVRRFSTELIEFFKENQKIAELSKSLFLIKENLNKISQLEKDREKNEKPVELIIQKIKQLEIEKEKILGEIKKIKESEEYRKNQEKIKKIERLEEELKNEILSLEHLIDFKALSNFYHVFEDQMKMVKVYKENFIEHFQKEGGGKILNLLDEAKLKNKEITEKTQKINLKKEEIQKTMNEIEEDRTKNLNSKISRTEQEISYFEEEKLREEKALGKLENAKEEFSKAIKEEFKKWDIEIEEN